MSEQTETPAADPEAGAEPAPVAEQNGAGETEPETPTPAPEEAPKASALRHYGVFTEHTLDLSGAAVAKKALEHLQSMANDAGELVVLVRVGKAIAPGPAKAIKMLGQHMDLNGDYQVVADSQRTAFKNVVTGMKRDVSIGG